MVARIRSWWPQHPRAAWGFVVVCALAVVATFAVVQARADLGDDVVAPTVPSDVIATSGAASPTIASVSWSASTDESGVVGYKVWRSVAEEGPFESIGTTAGTDFDDRAGVPAQDYFYAVTAYDAAGNESDRSTAAGPTSSAWTATPHGGYGPTTDYCSWCHVPHQAAAELGLRETGDTLGGELSICYTCHDGGSDAADVASGSPDSFSMASGHTLEQTATAADLTNNCSGCHSLHRSQAEYPNLPASKVNSATVTNDVEWCEACHNDAEDWVDPGYPTPDAPTRDASGYPVMGTFAGPLTYDDTTSSAHASIPASPSAGRSEGSCLYCHAAHRGTNEYDALRGTFRPSDASTVASDQADGLYADTCFYCHGGAIPSELTTAPADIRQFVTAAGANSGHRIRTAGGILPAGAPLPCYDCHNPHGSARANRSLLSDELGENLDTSTESGTRQVCLSCHTSSDGQIWDSTEGAPAAVGSQTVEGLKRDGSDGSVLRLSEVPGHAWADGDSCARCHGDDYASGGSNVHNPGGGISPGGIACYQCHSVYQEHMEDSSGATTGTSNSTVYHHVLGGAAGEGDMTATVDAYPTSTTDVYCVSCHADHDIFNASKAGNLRSDVTSASGTATASADYRADTNDGICTSCHATSLTKQGPGSEQKSDGSTATAKITAGSDPGEYGATAHDYAAQSSFGDGSTFDANCTKCHNDENDPAYKSAQTTADKFGLHWSAWRRVISAFGAPASDPVSENHCYGCHSGAGPNDRYGVQPMSAAARAIQGQFQLASKHPVAATGGNSVECESCHNPHVVNATGKVTDPWNTYLLIGYTTGAEKVAFCLKCHAASASLPVAGTDETTHVPSTVTISAPEQQRMDKSTYSSTAHWTAGGSIATTETQACSVCHDSHGSAAPSLLGVFDPLASANMINGFTITANDNTVCFACHTVSSTGFPSATTDASGYPVDGTWPGMGVYSIGYDPVNNTGSMHNTTNAVLPGKIYTGGACNNCHDVHGTANAQDELRTEDQNGALGVFGYSAGDFSFCFNCHDSDGPAGRDIASFYPASVGGADGGDGHAIATSGGNLPVGGAVPCYDCHNPHGSQSSAYGLTVVSELAPGVRVLVGDTAGEIQMSPAQQAADAENVRNFCFTCHTTADTTKGWDGAALVAVTAGAEVEGLDRTTSAVLHLSGRSGHYEADTADNCYTCHGSDYTVPSGENVHNP